MRLRFGGDLSGVWTAAAVAASVFLHSYAAASEPLRLTAEDCVTIAHANSEELASAMLGAEVARGQVIEARAVTLPNVNANVSYSRFTGLAGQSPFAGIIPGLDADSLYQASIALSQVIYQAEARYGLKATRVANEQARVMAEVARAGLVRGVRRTYAAALLQKSAQDVAAESVELARRHLANVESRRAAETVTDFEVLQARVQLRNAEARLLQERSAARLAAQQLLRVIGVEQDQEVELLDELTYAPEDLPPADALVARALGRDRERPGRMELYAQNIQIDVQDILLSVSTASRQPSVFAQVDYAGMSYENWFHEDFAMDLSLGLQVSIPIFDGLQASGRRRQALAQLEQARLAKRSLERDTEFEIRSAYTRVQNAREFVESQTEAVEEAREAVRLARVRYENDLAPEIVVDQMRLELAQARMNLTRALYDHHVALIDLRHSVGGF